MDFVANLSVEHYAPIVEIKGESTFKAVKREIQAYLEAVVVLLRLEITPK